MKKIMFLILCLALMSLACLQTAVVAQNIPQGDDVSVTVTTSPTFVKIQVHAAEPTLTKTPAAVGDQQICAKVVAIESLHLRQEASENSRHLAYMQHGEIVRVLDQSNGDWWFIERKGINGYARSMYLRESECE